MQGCVAVQENITHLISAAGTLENWCERLEVCR